MIALIFCGDLKYCPYRSRYIERLEIYDIDYRIYFWNRSAFDIEENEHYVYYNSKSELTRNAVVKTFDFWGYRNWLINKLNEDSVDKIIVLSTLTGVLLGKFLYGGDREYVFDIRDYSYEYIKPFYDLEDKLIQYSFFTAISSKGFKNFLPPFNYIMAHNFNRREIPNNAKFEKRNDPLNFVWNGVVRFFDYQRQYLDALKNDKRFLIRYYGDGPELEKYKEYCRVKGFSNILFMGAYENSEKEKILKGADILNNCYGYIRNPGNKLKYAVSNRFYDGIIFHIPQFVEDNGVKKEWVQKYNVGISLSIGKDFADSLYQYYQSINQESFDNSCRLILDTVIKEDDLYIEKIDEFLLR